MPSLNWIGKKAVLTHHRDVPFRLLTADEELSCSEEPTGNILVQGDNLDALKALLPRYAGRVKCIYIDPPYNTGREDWTYNDNVSSPQIAKWLGQIVGKEGDTLDRHDRWLCMMYPRLVLLKQFLRIDGIILISVDDNEVQSLRYLMDEIFGRKCFVSQFVWNTDGHTDNQYAIKVNHEYIVAYSARKNQATFGYVVDPNTREESNLWAGVAENSITKNGRANPPSEVDLPIGFPVGSEEINLPRTNIPIGLVEAMKSERLSSNPLKARFGKVQFPLRLDPMLGSAFMLTHHCRVFSGWANANKLKRFIEGGCVPITEDDGSMIRFYLSGSGVIYYVKERGDRARNITSVLRNMGTTEKMRAELELMGLKFDYPKPKELIKYLIRVASESGDLVMDSFAGSGTTGHAVLELSQEGSPRDFILIEMDEETAETVTAERLRKVASGYVDTKGRTVQGTGGGFTYCSLSSEPIFTADGSIRSDVTFEELAQFVWFIETGTGLNRGDVPSVISPLLGFFEGTAIYLLYNGILRDTSASGGNVLDVRTLRHLNDLASDPLRPKIVYAARTLLDAAKLTHLGVTHKQLPYELSVKSWF